MKDSKNTIEIHVIECSVCHELVEPEYFKPVTGSPICDFCREEFDLPSGPSEDEDYRYAAPDDQISERGHREITEDE